ncbi:MAG: nitroreductase family protein [Paramuribaculum sp.]|nr:nitroreductase family protein [Paramuribaculum sp.]
MKNSTYLIILLALGLVFTSYKWISTSSQTNDEQTRNTTIADIMSRTSVRSYSGKEVESEKIDTLLRAAMAAPTAGNKQPWRFIVVNDKAVLNAIGTNFHTMTMAKEASVAVVMCGDTTATFKGDAQAYWVQDVSAASENLLLAAHAMGLGAVWCGIYPQRDRVTQFSQMLGLPENIIPMACICIGYPAGETTPKDKWKPENIHYNTWDSVATKLPEAKEKTFSEFDVTKQWSENPFNFFRGDGLLLAAGNRESNNAMTIGWGALGNIWQRDASTVTVYVAEGRYTYQFMENSKYFTVMQFDREHSNVLSYMGSHSGRDGDKAAALGLHTLYTEHGTPYYAEATLVLECELLYHYKFLPEGMNADIQRFYSNFPAGVHHQYIGKIVKALRK